jgi:hypothetical protein
MKQPEQQQQQQQPGLTTSAVQQQQQLKSMRRRLKRPGSALGDLLGEFAAGSSKRLELSSLLPVTGGAGQQEATAATAAGVEIGSARSTALPGSNEVRICGVRCIGDP